MFQRDSIKPCRKRNSAVHRTVNASLPNGRHIRVHKNCAFISGSNYAGQVRWNRNRLAIFLHAIEGYPKKFTRRKQGIIIINSTGGNIQVGEKHGYFFALFVRKHSRINIAVGFL